MEEDIQQQVRDMWAVWSYIRVYGGTLNQKMVSLNKPNSRYMAVFHADTHGEDWLHKASMWAQDPYQK